MSRLLLSLVLWLALAAALLAGGAEAAEGRSREKRTLDLLLRGLAQALGYEVRPIRGRGAIPATDPPPRSAGGGGAPSGAQKERESTTPSLPEPVTDPRVRPPYDVDDLLSYRGQQRQGGASPGSGATPTTAPPPTTPAGSAGPTPPPEDSAISQFVRANAGTLLNAEFDRTQLGRGPGGIRCRDELALPEPPHYPGYGPDFDSGPHLDYQKGDGQQREPDHSTETGGPQLPHQPSHPAGDRQHQPQDASHKGPSSGGPGRHTIPTTSGQAQDQLPQVPSYNSVDGPGKQPLQNFADVLFGPLEPEQKQPSQPEQGQNGPAESAHSESDGDAHRQKQPASGDPDGGYFGVVLGAPLHYSPVPSDDHSFSKQHRHQAEREQEEVNREGAYVGIIVQAPLPPQQAHGTQQQHQVHHRGPNSEQLFHQWTSAAPTVYPSLQPYIFSYTVPAWASRRSEEAAEAPAHSHLSLLEEPVSATGGYFPQGGAGFQRRAEFSEEDLPEPLRLDRAEEEAEEEQQEEEDEAEEEAEEEGPQQQHDYDEEAPQQEETPPPPPPPPTPHAPRSSAAAPGGSVPPPAAGSLLQQLPLPLPLPPASTHAPPMLQLLQQRQQPPPRGAGGGGGGAPGAGVGVGALWPPPPFDSAASALQASSHDLLASTEKRAAGAGERLRHRAAGQVGASPSLSAAAGAPSAEFPIHYNRGYGPGLVLVQTAAPGRALPATAASLALEAAPTPALDAGLPWTYYTDPANHRHNFAFSTAGQRRADTREAATSSQPVLSTPGTWALLAVPGGASPTKVYKRHAAAAAARSWAFHSEQQHVFLTAGDDDSDSDGSGSQPEGVRQLAPMTHSESFGSLWRDFVARMSIDDDDDSEAAGSQEEGAVWRPARSGRHLPTYHRDPLGHVSKYVPDDDDDAGFVGASSVLRTRVAEGRSQKQEQPGPTPTSGEGSGADGKVEAVSWPSYSDPVLYGEALEKQEQQQQGGEAPQPGAGGGASQDTTEGSAGSTQQTEEDTGREAPAEKQPSNSWAAPSDESGREGQPVDGATKSDEQEGQREEFVPYFARPEHYRISRHEEQEEEESQDRPTEPQPGASDLQQGGSQHSGVAAQRRRKPWYFQDPGPRYGGSRRRQQEAEPRKQHQRRQHQKKDDVWDYYGNPDNFYVPPDTLSTIVIGKEGGEEQSEGGGRKDQSEGGATRGQSQGGGSRRGRGQGARSRGSRESAWPPPGFRSGTHHSAGPRQQQQQQQQQRGAQPEPDHQRSPHFAHRSPYHTEYQYPEVEYTPLSASAATGASTAEGSDDGFPWSLYKGSPSHFFSSHKSEVPANASGTARTETSSKGRTGSSGGQVKGKEAGGPDPVWQLAVRALAHAAAATAGKPRAPGPQGGSGGQAGGGRRPEDTTEHYWFPSYEKTRTPSDISPAGDPKREDVPTFAVGDHHWTPYTSPFSQNADTGVDASPWPPEPFFQQPAALDYGKASGAGPPSGQQQQAVPTAPPRQEANTTTTSSSGSSSSSSSTSAAALLGLLLPRFLLPAAAAPTAQEVLQSVRPQVRVSVAPSEGGGVATVASVEPVRYEFSTETTLLAPLSAGGLSRETVSRASSLHLTGHFQVNPEDRGDADEVARPKSRIAAAAAI